MVARFHGRSYSHIRADPRRYHGHGWHFYGCTHVTVVQHLANFTCVAVEIGYVVWAKRLGLAFIDSPLPRPASYSNTREIGKVLYTEYVYPFEIASVILLLGIIAAIMLTLRRREGTRHQDPARQVRVNRNDRVRLVKVPTEKEEQGDE